jgi:hypothetical protein
MWGKANYFALNSSYSNNYAFKDEDGSRKMFMALVTLGKDIKMQPDRNLRQPPN